MVLVCAATTSVSSPWRREVSSELRALVAAGCRVLGEADQGDLIWGHVSARDPDGRGVWMKASGLGFDEIGPDEVILVGWDGEVLEGDRRRHAEYPIHTEVVRARADVGAVMHTHSRAAVALGALGAPLRPISHEANLFVPPELARFTQTGDLILTARRGTAGAPQPTGTLAAVVDGGLATFGRAAVGALHGPAHAVAQQRPHVRGWWRTPQSRQITSAMRHTTSMPTSPGATGPYARVRRSIWVNPSRRGIPPLAMLA